MKKGSHHSGRRCWFPFFLLSPCGCAAADRSLLISFLPDGQDALSSTAWNSHSHGVELTVPGSGTRSPRLWNSESQALELGVPGFGTRSPKPWNSESQAVELEVPSRGTRSPKPWNSKSQAHGTNSPAGGSCQSCLQVLESDRVGRCNCRMKVGFYRESSACSTTMVLPSTRKVMPPLFSSIDSTSASSA